MPGNGGVAGAAKRHVHIARAWRLDNLPLLGLSASRCWPKNVSGSSAGRVDKSLLDELVVTDSILHSEQVKKSKKIRTITVAPLMGEAIRRIANEESVSKLFD